MKSPEGWRELRRALRIGPLLAVAAAAGYLLGGCGGGDLSGLTGFSGVTELPTLTLPTLPTESETAPGTTAEAPTTAPPPVTIIVETETETAPTTPATTSTLQTDTGAGEPPSDSNGLLGWLVLAIAAAQGDETTTSLEAPPETSPDTSGTETVAAEPPSSETSTPWGWIGLAAGLALAGVIVGLVVWRRRRRRSGSG